MTQPPAIVQRAEIQAAAYWYDTKITVREGHTYRVDLRFPSECASNAVYDASIYIGNLSGWPAPAKILGAPVFFLRRNPFHPWFALMATVKRKDPQRLIAGQTYTPRSTGPLVCYFNDAFWAYGNNHGAVELVVRDLGGPARPSLSPKRARCENGLREDIVHQAPPT